MQQWQGLMCLERTATFARERLKLCFSPFKYSGVGVFLTVPTHLVRVTCISKRFIGIFMSLVDTFVFFFLGRYTYGTDDLICLLCVCLVSSDILYDLQCTFNKVQCIKDVHRYRTETHPRTEGLVRDRNVT